MRPRGIFGLLLGMALLSSTASACWMPAAQCEQAAKRPCHGTEDAAAPSQGCCGQPHLSAARLPASASLTAPARELAASLEPPAAPSASARTSVTLIRSLGPPRPRPAALRRSPSRSPPAA